MTIDQIVDAYADELENWDFFSDGQRAYVDENGHIVVCLRNYNWYITKNSIKTDLTLGSGYHNSKRKQKIML